MLTTLFIISRVFSKMSRRGPRPLVICGPSGSGKSTLLNKLFEEYPNTFGFSTSHTTRNPRPGEEHGVHYFFISKEDMENAIKEGEFLETASFSGNLYGTSKGAVRNVQNSGKVCILDIEIQGVEQIRTTELDPILIFNNPPSLSALETRLRKRNTESEETLRNRLKAAEIEITYGLVPGNFHKIVHNHDIEEAYNEFRSFVISELKAQESNGIQICWN